jgi:DNA-binding protein HU-beta
VIKLDIVNRVADQTGVPKMKAEQAVDALFHSMKEALARGERIELRGFGVFIVKPRKRGVGRNPRTGEEVAIPSGKTIRFKPGKELQAHGFVAEEEVRTPPRPAPKTLRPRTHTRPARASKAVGGQALGPRPQTGAHARPPGLL